MAPLASYPETVCSQVATRGFPLSPQKKSLTQVPASAQNKFLTEYNRNEESSLAAAKW
jgi:hypothetical protein